MVGMIIQTDDRFDRFFDNKKGFIIGGGTSLSKISQSIWDRLKNEITIGTNASYELIESNFLVIGDLFFWKAFKNEINKLKSIVFSPYDVLINKNCFVEKQIFALKREKKDYKKLSNSLADTISWWNNVGVTALRIAYILGINPIYLLGFDLQDNHNRHNFHDKYEKKRPYKVEPPYNNFYESFEVVIKQLEEKNVKVISCNEYSKLNKIIEYKQLELC